MSIQIGKVEVPCGQRGEWKIESFRITKSMSRWTALRAMLKGFRGEYCPPGRYKKLVRGDVVVMSNTKMEVDSNREFIQIATGHVLINGLGLGMVLTAILQKEDVISVTVVEKDADVIALVGPTFKREKRLTIIHSDALEFNPPKGVRYNAVWHDIWDTISADNIPQMIKLHRKYGRRTDWQGSWMRHKCEELNRW